MSGSTWLLGVDLQRVFAEPTSPWVPYYAAWPFALDPASAPLYDLVADLPVFDAVVIDRPTFGKWDVATAAALAGVTEIVLTGVSTDC